MPPIDPKDPPLLGTVASDGGPLLLGPREAFAGWEGARADGAPHGDYYEACRRAEDLGDLERGGAPILVLPTYSADVLQHPDGSLWLAIEGNLEEVWAAREDIAFKPLGRTLDAEGLTLLDAAYPLSRAEGEDNRAFALPRLAARFALDNGTEAEVGGFFRVLRLRTL
jgi:hypothetical protein